MVASPAKVRSFNAEVRAVLGTLADELAPTPQTDRLIDPEQRVRELTRRMDTIEAAMAKIGAAMEAERLSCSAAIRDAVRLRFNAARERLLAAVLEVHHAGTEYEGLLTELRDRNVSFVALGPLPLHELGGIGGSASGLSKFVRACRAEKMIEWSEIPAGLK